MFIIYNFAFLFRMSVKDFEGFMLTYFDIGTNHANETVHFKQEVSSEKIIAEANMVLFSLNKDSGTVKGSKLTFRMGLYNDSRCVKMS